MKLFSIPHSPYAARVRLQIDIRNLPVEIVEPTGGLGSDSYKSLGGLGKVPALAVDGHHLYESVAIMEFLEDYYEAEPLRSLDKIEAAKQRALIRYCDLYFGPALFPLFAMLKAPKPEAVATAMAKLKTEMKTLERLLQEDGRQIGEPLDFADVAIAPAFHYAMIVPPILGDKTVLDDTPWLAEWWQALMAQPPVAKCIDEINAGVKAMMSGA